MQRETEKYNQVGNHLDDKTACPPFNPPKSRAGKLFFFRHYHTDAPI
jgi:hypothetical protein